MSRYLSNGGRCPPYFRELKKIRLQQELSRVNYMLDSMRLKSKEKDDPIPYEVAYLALILPQFNRLFNSHWKYLTDTKMFDTTFAVLYDPNLDPAFIDVHFAALTGLIAEPFTIAWAVQNQDDITAIVTNMYKAGIETASSIAGTPVPPVFSTIDTRAINQMSTMGTIWVSEGARQQVVSGSVRTLVAQALQQNMNVAEAGALFRRELGHLVPLRGEAYFNGLASTVMNRTRNYARVFEWYRLDSTYLIEILAIGDDRTCDFCMLMDGKTFTIQSAFDAAMRAVEASTPEELIDVAPFKNNVVDDNFVLSNGITIPTNSESELLAQSGLCLPSYHPSCRCQVLIYMM